MQTQSKIHSEDKQSHQNDITTSPQEEQKPIPFVIFENGKFIIPQEAKALLCKETYQNIGIISLVGKYRTGKSFLLNRVLLNRVQSPGFGVGPTIKPCTKGIWIWSHPLMISNSHCKEPFPCFLIDTEGLGAYDEEVNHDSKIFLIAILISSLFIFNSFGTIDENAINSLSFVLNLSKTIKLRNNSTIDNEEELAEYFPTLYWLLRDFSLKLEDHDGNVITEKQYLEYALQTMKGSSEIIEEKNKVRCLIRTYFPERDCFVMVRPVEKESDLQNMSKLPDSQLRKEFLEQAKMFRNKVMKKTKPKLFMKKNLTGEMLVELVQSVLNAINGGNIPVIENSWKYVIQAECIKRSNNSIVNFHDELSNYRKNNMNNPTYVKTINQYTKDLADKYMEEFTKNGLFDEDSKAEFSKKLRAKLDEEIKKFEKENEGIFEQKFMDALNDKAKKFMFGIDSNDKYSKNYFQFFTDLEQFRTECEDLTPDFPHKRELLFDKLMVIIRKFIDTYFVKVKLQTEKQISMYKNAIEKLQSRLKEVNDELISNNKTNSDSINKLNAAIGNEKVKQKEYENKIMQLQHERQREKDVLEQEIINTKKDYEQKLKQLQNTMKQTQDDLVAKEEEILQIKMNNDKISSLNAQKISFLEKELNELKDKYHNESIEHKENTQSLRDEITLLKAQNETLKAEHKKNEETKQNQVTENMNSILNYIQEGLKMQNQKTKLMFEQIMTNQQEKEINASKDKELLNNYKETTLKNQELTLSLAASETKLKTYEEQMNKLNMYKDIIHASSGIKCKYCSKVLPLDSFKAHYELCQKNVIGFNTSNIECLSLDKLKIKILKGTVKQDEVGKAYLEYIIDIWYNGQNWRINKRFNQFANLYKTLKSIFRGVVDMPTSSNIFVNINGVGKSSSFHENKLIQLEKFIKDLSQIEAINKSKPFRKFLEFEHFVDEEQEIEIKQHIENSRYGNSMIHNNNHNLMSSIAPKMRGSSIGEDGLFEDALDP